MSLVALPGPDDRVGVGGAREVRHDVAGLQAQFLEEERVSGRQPLRRGRAARRQAHAFLHAAVHRVHEVKTRHAEVIIRLRFDEHLVDARRAQVAAGLRKRDDGRLIVEYVDGVLGGRAHQVSGRACEIDPVGAVVAHLEAAAERAVGVHRERRFVTLAADHPAALRGERGVHAEADRGAAEHGDVAAVFDLPRLEAGVGGEHVLEFQPIDERQFGRLNPEHRTIARRPPGRNSPATGAGRRRLSRTRLRLRSRSSPRARMGRRRRFS